MQKYAENTDSSVPIENEPVEIRLSWAKNPKTSPDILKRLSQDSFWFVRDYVACNSSTPRENLVILSQDPDFRIRKDAEKNLKRKEGKVRIMSSSPQIVNAGYTISDSITLMGNTYVLGHNPKAPAPYVTWQENISGGFVYGRYFATPEAARQDLFKRSMEVLPEQEKEILIDSLVSRELRDKIARADREEGYLSDIESCLYDALDYLEVDSRVCENLMKNSEFKSRALHVYFKQDHSAENEALTESLEMLLKEKFPEYLEANKFIELAEKLDAFSFDYDTYEYQDTVGSDSEKNIQKIADDLMTGNFEPYQKYLKESIRESEDSELIETAQELLAEVKALDCKANPKKLKSLDTQIQSAANRSHNEAFNKEPLHREPDMGL